MQSNKTGQLSRLWPGETVPAVELDPFPSPGSTSRSSSSPAEYPDPAMAWRARPAVPVYSAFCRNWRPSMHSADR